MQSKKRIQFGMLRLVQVDNSVLEIFTTQATVLYFNRANTQCSYILNENT